MDGYELQRMMTAQAIMRRIYQDDRFPPPTMWGDLRLFALTATWVRYVERPPRGELWMRVATIMHLNRPTHRFWRLIETDLPRYEPDWGLAGETPCEAPMVRREGPCGRSGSTSVRVTDPATGAWRLAWYCTRHKEHAAKVQRIERARREAGTLPEPLPNRGGLLPCYLPPRLMEKWYAKVAARWEPPAVGICADDWPVMTKLVNPEPTTLKVVFGGVEDDEEHLPDDPNGERHLRAIPTSTSEEESSDPPSPMP